MMRNANGGRFRGTRKFKFMTPNSSYSRWVRFPVRYSADFGVAVFGVTPFASKSDVKHAYKRLALEYQPDVIRGENVSENHQNFMNIKSVMQKFKEEGLQAIGNYDEFDEWEEWMGFEGGISAVYKPF